LAEFSRGKLYRGVEGKRKVAALCKQEEYLRFSSLVREKEVLAVHRALSIRGPAEKRGNVKTIVEKKNRQLGWAMGSRRGDQLYRCSFGGRKNSQRKQKQSHGKRIDYSIQSWQR